MVEKSDLSEAVPSKFNHMYEPMRRFGEKVADFFSPNSEAATTDKYYEISIELPGVWGTRSKRCRSVADPVQA